MNYFDLYSSYPDRTIVAAWDSQIKEADHTPWITETLNQRASDLFPRFATCYAELQALPRSARRALQRRLARSSELAAILPEYLQQGGRRLQHRMAWSLAGAALLLALGQGAATAATIAVTTNNPNIVADGQCSLIEAIVNANNDTATHADCAAGSGADTIALPANANITLSNAYGTPYGDVGLPLIGSRITIEGNGAVIARNGSATDFFGLMVITKSGNLTLRQVTLSGGLLGGFGALGNHGTLTIENSTISGNADHGGGGGVSNFGTSTIQNSTISNNTTNYGGGGVSNSGTLTIKNSVLSNNLTYYFGGGVNNDDGTLTIENSTISGNTAFGGGGVETFRGSVTISNSTISGTVANSNGGGLRNAGYVSSGILMLRHSLIAGNQATVSPEIENSSFGIVTANYFNLFGVNGDAGVNGFAPGLTDIVPSVSLAQILGPLANNGGPSQTHALVPGSPAIDAGDPAGCRDSLGKLFLTEQRGFARHADGNNDGTIRCDIGAFEFGAESVPIPSVPLALGATTLAAAEVGVSFSSDLMISGGVGSYVVAITKGNLPKGLSLGNNGIISGTPSNARSEKVTVRITDSVNESITQTFTITVLKALRIAGKLRTGRTGQAYSDSLKPKGGLGPFSWTITSGAVPGLSFNNATGAFTGIPTQVGEFPLTVQVSDALGGVDAENLTLKVK